MGNTVPTSVAGRILEGSKFWHMLNVSDNFVSFAVTTAPCGSQGKERKIVLYSTFKMRMHTQSAQTWLTQFYLQTTPCLPFLHKHSPDGAITTEAATSSCSLLLIYQPRRDERLSLPGWLAYSGWFTHISGHPSATGQAQDKESSPAKDRRSTVVPRDQPSKWVSK